MKRSRNFQERGHASYTIHYRIYYIIHIYYINRKCLESSRRIEKISPQGQIQVLRWSSGQMMLFLSLQLQNLLQTPSSRNFCHLAAIILSCSGLIPVKRLIWNPALTLKSKESKPSMWDYPPPCILLFCGKLGPYLFLWNVSTIKATFWGTAVKKNSPLKKKKMLWE